MAKFLICTMWCGELDYEHCVEAIKAQIGGHEVEHRTFANMIEVDAHNCVYGAFNDAAPDVICGKVDADVVLFPNALEQVAARCGGHTWLDPQTHDYFTDGYLSAGLAFYGPDVTFQHQTLTLKCDRDVASTRSPTGGGVLGNHAHHADEWTGFRYGFHRGLKSQLPVYEQVKAAYARNKDPVRLAAIRGFELAQSDMYIGYHTGKEPVPTDHNYNSPRLHELYDQYYKDVNMPLPARTWR